jgi:ankyrin repeat protein
MAFGNRTFCRMRMIAAVIAVLALWVTVSRGEGCDLVSAAYYGDLSEVKRLLAAGANVNAKEKNGITALMAASLAGHREVAALLLAKGAEVNAKDKNGKTALMFATRMNHPEVRELLIKAGAK